ncbi:helix-turn-helix transcriptional regulator [Robertmurraya sp. DFI.2.37]|uniref:helix-turn-helix transcriptional regulator n=1 Tax=Robertmurraya sp. DFI.2.37 TaxID=3031819 RepID=UPI0017809D9B|nr:helix-turn-helix transcriptional regulator [Robertmurraya sp. DFI.2.37]MDF1511173.1 helix-turn-helix transcriptional regulator [Robertmurraya sp. DFI.2.37]
MDVIVICKLRDRRKAQGLSQRDLGALVNIDHKAIGNYETNKTKMNILTAAKLAIVLNCKIDDLYEYRRN